MQPVVQSGLQIEHPALIAPRLNFFDPVGIRVRYPEFHKTKGVVRITAVAEPKPAAAPRI